MGAQSSDEQALALRYDSNDPYDFCSHVLQNSSSAIPPTPSLSLHPSPHTHASNAPIVPKLRSIQNLLDSTLPLITPPKASTSSFITASVTLIFLPFNMISHCITTFEFCSSCESNGQPLSLKIEYL